MAKAYAHHETIIFPAMTYMILHRSAIAQVMRNVYAPIL